MDQIKYPAGEFSLTQEPSAGERLNLISGMQTLPDKLHAAVRDLNDEQLNTTYRSGSWTVRQVVHHLADSHMNGFLRFKWALTEVRSEIKIYNQDAWARTPESNSAPALISVALLKSLHERWVFLLRKMNDEDFDKIYLHPETGPMTLSKALALYEWHGRHHTAQIQSLRERMKWV